VIQAPIRIRTPRLLLVQPQRSDAVSIFQRYASDPAVTRFLSWPRHQSLQDTQAFLDASDEQWARWPAGPYLIRARDSAALLGGTGLEFKTSDQAATGYVLAKDSWGRGFATEVLAAIVHLSRQLGVRRLSALCHPEHRASLHVLEKCGFTRDDTENRQAEFPNIAPGVLQHVLRYTALL